MVIGERLLIYGPSKEAILTIEKDNEDNLMGSGNMRVKLPYVETNMACIPGTGVPPVDYRETHRYK